MKKILDMSDSDSKWLIDRLIEVAKLSTCKRSKCGSIIVDSQVIIGEGFNSMPCQEIAECFKDNIPTNFKSDRNCCVHAEQRAIMDAIKREGNDLRGSYLFFIRLDENDNPVHSGEPYCTICSKMALDSGISKFCLWHKGGWTAYDTKYYNELSFQYK